MRVICDVGPGEHGSGYKDMRGICARDTVS